jgi:hypothetical protein
VLTFNHSVLEAEQQILVWMACSPIPGEEGTNADNHHESTMHLVSICKLAASGTDPGLHHTCLLIHHRDDGLHALE